MKCVAKVFDVIFYPSNTFVFIDVHIITVDVDDCFNVVDIVTGNDIADIFVPFYVIIFIDAAVNVVVVVVVDVVVAKVVVVNVAVFNGIVFVVIYMTILIYNIAVICN